MTLGSYNASWVSKGVLQRFRRDLLAKMNETWDGDMALVASTYDLKNGMWIEDVPAPPAWMSEREARQWTPPEYIMLNVVAMQSMPDPHFAHPISCIVLETIWVQREIQGRGVLETVLGFMEDYARSKSLDAVLVTDILNVLLAKYLSRRGYVIASSTPNTVLQRGATTNYAVAKMLNRADRKTFDHALMKTANFINASTTYLRQHGIVSLTAILVLS